MRALGVHDESPASSLLGLIKDTHTIFHVPIYTTFLSDHNDFSIFHCTMIFLHEFSWWVLWLLKQGFDWDKFATFVGNFPVSSFRFPCHIVFDQEILVSSCGMHWLEELKAIIANKTNSGQVEDMYWKNNINLGTGKVNKYMNKEKFIEVWKQMVKFRNLWVYCVVQRVLEEVWRHIGCRVRINDSSSSQGGKHKDPFG